MSQGGRPRKPTALRVLEGNRGKRPLPVGEPQPRQERPTCPRWLMLEAKREWRRIVPELGRLGLLTIIDRAALAAYCQAYACWRQAEEDLARLKSTVVATPSGYIQQLPQVTISQKERMIMHRFLVEFGLTPASRSRLSVPQKVDDSEFERMLG